MKGQGRILQASRAGMPRFLADSFVGRVGEDWFASLTYGASNERPLSSAAAASFASRWLNASSRKNRMLREDVEPTRVFTYFDRIRVKAEGTETAPRISVGPAGQGCRR